MSDKPFDLITIGDSTIDTFIRIHDASVECDVNKQDCKLIIQYGSKIPVDSIDYSVAGNAANVAAGAAKLGLKTAIYTNLGDDDQGRTIKTKLSDAGISPTYIKENAGKKSNLSVVLTFQGERTIFVYHQDWYYKLPQIEKSEWIYLTSMAETFVDSNIMDEVVAYIKKSGARLVFGPGTFQLKADIKRSPEVLENCELLIVNKEEAKRILNIEQTEMVDPRDLLAKLLLLGPKSAVVTDAEDGSYGCDGKQNFKLGVFPTQVVEKTGAGDAYSSGMIAGLFYGLPFEEAMVWGTINASHEIQESGTQKGIMNKEDIERHRKTVPELSAVQF